MTVEAMIKNLLESSQGTKKLNEYSAGDVSRPKQGSSKDASYTDAGDVENEKPTVNVGKDTSKAATAAVAGDKSQPKQGDSKDSSYEDIQGDTVGKKASSKMSKDTSMKPKIKGDATNDMQGSSKKATYTEDTDSDDEDFEDEDEDLDEEALDELSKGMLGQYINKAKGDMSAKSFVAGKSEKDELYYTKRAGKRGTGIERAVKKLTKEEVESIFGNVTEDDLDEETLDELSKGKLGQYINKAKGDMSAKSFVAGKSEKDELHYTKRAGKRGTGIERAVKKLTGQAKVKATESVTFSEEEVKAIFGQDVSEEVQEKVTGIFEAAVIARVNEEMIAIEEQLIEGYETELANAIEENKQDLVEKVDAYLNYITDTWLEDNRVQVENTLKLQAMENFMENLKTLFVESYIEIPEDKVDVVEELQSQVNDLEDRLNEEIAKNIESHNLISEARRLSVVDEAVVGLADTEIDKFNKLIEGIDFNDEDSYAEKLKVIRQSHFNKKLDESRTHEIADEGGVVIDTDSTMAKYMETISRSVKK